jgi:hypothetical protein
LQEGVEVLVLVEMVEVEEVLGALYMLPHNPLLPEHTPL